MRKISYRQAINEALHQEMEADDKVFTYGIDVGDHKRIFGTTNGLVEKFGKDRCFSTPLAEDAMTGFGLGAAINGLKPIHVHMRVDFLTLAMNQLSNMVSSFKYGANGDLEVPFVIRAIIGRGWGQAYQHSKSMQSVFAHLPGLRVVMPATPSEAKGLLIAAIRSNDPVIVMEHRWLYDAEDEVEEEAFELPLDKSAIIREGSDVTVLATSWMNVEALKAAEVLEKVGVSVEIVNARCIDFSGCVENDMAIYDSVEKTKNCIIVDNDWVHCGFSGELAAQIYDLYAGGLNSPISRIGFTHIPCPCSRPLENMFYPGAKDIIREVEDKLGLMETDLSDEDFYSYENKFKGPF